MFLDIESLPVKEVEEVLSKKKIEFIDQEFLPIRESITRDAIMYESFVKECFHFVEWKTTQEYFVILHSQVRKKMIRASNR